jgi:hypothetical protein
LLKFVVSYYRYVIVDIIGLVGHWGVRTITQRDTAHLDMIRFPRISRDYSTQKKKKKKKKKKKTEKVRQSVTSDQQKYRNFLKNKKLTVVSEIAGSEITIF